MIIKHSYRYFLIHIGFWFLYILIRTVFLGSHEGNFMEVFILTIIDLPAYIFATYLFISFMVPRYLYTGKYLKFYIVFVFVCSVPVFIKWGTDYFIKYPVYFGKPININHFCTFTFSRDFINIYFIVAIAISLLFIKNWYKKQHENQLLAQKNKEAELSLVKAQLNPHFLFNTLNNLYSLASNKSQEVPNVILQLSDLLNYVLYDCNSKWVSLNKEIYFLKNYVELEKLRYGSRLTFEFITKGDFEKIAIAPMVLITFVENCFKHGVSKVRVNPFVKISISRNKQMLYFEAENSTPRANAEKEYPYQESIGLKNTKMRLDFLYHNNYELKIDKENHVFKVTLKIPLHEKV